MPVSEAMKLYAIFSSVIALQMLLLALWTGTVRTLRKQYVNPEDAKLNKAEQTEQDHEDVLRIKRAHQNLIENAVPFFAVGFLYAVLAPSKTAALIYFGTFVGARILHTFFYLGKMQPFRTLMFAVGVLATIGMAVHVIRMSL